MTEVAAVRSRADRTGIERRQRPAIGSIEQKDDEAELAGDGRVDLRAHESLVGHDRAKRRELDAARLGTYALLHRGAARAEAAERLEQGLLGLGRPDQLVDQCIVDVPQIVAGRRTFIRS